MTAESHGRRRHGRWFDLAASVLIGLVLVGAALIPAATASSGQTTTIRGDVTLAGKRVPFFPVGFWAPSDPTHPVQSFTDANGVFTLDVPVTTDGYAYAGTEPDDSEALTATDGREVVRGIIGQKPARPISTPLYAGWDPATGRSLAGGASELHFLLQGPGRIAGTSPVRGSALRGLQVRRLDGSVVQALTADSRGRFTSRWLAPGNYLVTAIPRAPMLPSVVEVAVTADATATALLPTPRAGATLDGTALLTDGRAAPSGVPVLLEQDGAVLQRTTTGSGGTYHFTGLASGDYTLDAGRFSAVDATGSTSVSSTASSPVTLPGPSAAASTPAPTATAPSPSASQQVLQPYVRTSDAVLPSSTSVTVPQALGDVPAVSTLAPAAVLRGQVGGADGTAVQVVVEEAGTGRMLRVVTAGSDGTWSAGGLIAGRFYTVWAITTPQDPSTAQMGTATGKAVASTAGPSDSDVEVLIDRPAATLQGSVGSATSGTVGVGDTDLFSRTAGIDRTGAYSVSGLVPGLYPVTVATGDRLAADPVPVTVGATGTTIDLQRGPVAATYKGWFISAGAGVPLASGTATGTTDDVVRFGPRTSGGHLTVAGLRPGTYTYDATSFAGTVPVSDGPWWFAPPSGTFALSDGATTDVGPVVLHVRAR